MKCCNGEKEKNIIGDDRHLVESLTGLLHKVLHHHDVDCLSQIVLHEIGHDDSFGLGKATYLIDNPDFDHLLGAAGYDCNECHLHKKELWENPSCFKHDMKDAHYHNNVKSFLNNSLRRKDINLNDAKEVKDLGADLGIKNPDFFSWNMKHGNHGLLIFEKSNTPVDIWKKGFFKNIAALLSFCGI